MTLQFQFGNYQHAASEVAIRSITRHMVLGSNGRPHYVDNNWQIEGKIVAPDASFSTVMGTYASIVSAYRQPNPSCVGFPNTALYQLASGCFGIPGIVATAPVIHGELKGADLGCAFLKYGAGVQFSTPFAQGGDVLDFSETMTFTDNAGLPLTVERVPQNGAPIIQQVSQGSFFYGSQSGSMTTAFTQPTPLPPLFPTLLRTSTGQARNYSYASPKQIRGKYVSYTVTWKYDYVSITPFFSYPNIVS